MDPALPPPPGFDEPGLTLMRGASPVPAPNPATAAPAESSLGQTAVGSSNAGTASGSSTAGVRGDYDDDDDDPPPPPPLQKRRTSSFEYHEDGPSQYDVLPLKARRGRGSGKVTPPMTPLFLDLLHAKIREAERQLHFALLSTRAHDGHDAAKRCSCALAELDYVRERAYLPPPIQLLECRILRTTAISLLAQPGDSRILASRKAEHLIQRAFQVLGELVDWDEVKQRGAAVEQLEEFLPMCYFNDSKQQQQQNAEGEDKDESEIKTKVDYMESMVLWYQMMIHHGVITLRKAEWKEQDAAKDFKVDNYAKACKLFAVGMEGLTELYEDGTDAEYISYKRIATGAMETIARIVVDNMQQDELLDIMAGTSKVDLENFKLLVMRAQLKKDEKRRKNDEELKMDFALGLAGDEGGSTKDKGKGKAKAEDDDEDETMVSPISPKPISARDKGKGKAILQHDEDDREKGLPSYSDVQNSEDWVMVEPKD
ncbi:hypothetical protein Dda_3338 [Drechslerella dactyloides]|uniref:Uncharacterized protein n=1 Tax=Drechslerella dactyloides TaxID=74499 RepID=A0AAD6J5N4_DREDA|nr:hypothetical protein Dda_3338 [Drechslerella dactyloides]